MVTAISPSDGARGYQRDAADQRRFETVAPR